jgi:ligand-binding SRPBCC domain-containing protein
MDRPRFFQDRMTAGPFASFEHDHLFEEAGGATIMRDEIRFRAPLGPIGRLAETLFLHRHLKHFLNNRNWQLKAVAESGNEWQEYVAR